MRAHAGTSRLDHRPCPFLSIHQSQMIVLLATSMYSQPYRSERDD
jgi:hypothetical protein